MIKKIILLLSLLIIIPAVYGMKLIERECYNTCTVKITTEEEPTYTTCQSGTYCYNGACITGNCILSTDNTCNIPGDCEPSYSYYGDTSACRRTTITSDYDYDNDGYCKKTLGGTDCNDNIKRIHPSASESCNNIDDNCNGKIDEATWTETCGTNIGECKYGTKSCDCSGCGSCTGNVGPTSEICTDSKDNDCDSYTDAKDMNCLQIKQITAPTFAYQNTQFQIKCETTIPTNCIQAKIEQQDCTFEKWDSNTAIFLCISDTTGTKTVQCYKTQEACTGNSQTENPTVTPKETTVIILTNECGQRTKENCATDEQCEWCLQCDGVYTNGLGGDTCVAKGTCGHTICDINCGALCDQTKTCSATNCDSLDKCYSGTYRDYTGETNSCKQDCTCETKTCETYNTLITDNDEDGYDTQCDNDCNDNNNKIYPGAMAICSYYTPTYDADCDGSTLNEAQTCCQIATSKDVDLNNEEIIKSEYLPEKVMDYEWINGKCEQKEYYDTCSEYIIINNYKYYLVEYYANGESYTTKTTSCAIKCTGQTQEQINYKQSTTITIETGCDNGACVKDAIVEECDTNTNELTEYYCDGDYLKKIIKDCDDYDTSTQDYSCTASRCTSAQYQNTLTGLKEGQIKIKLKNTGSMPFKGNAILTTQNFCPGQGDIASQYAVTLDIYATDETTVDLAQECDLTTDDYICNNELNYVSVCKFWPGGGCGALTHEEQSFINCKTCCNDMITNENECKNTNKKCDTSTIKLTIKNDNYNINREINNAAWCCMK